MSRADLTPAQIADLLQACAELIGANSTRGKSPTLTLAEQQAIGVLWVRIDEVAELEKFVTRPTTPLDTLQAEAVDLRGLIQQTNNAVAELRAEVEKLKVTP